METAEAAAESHPRGAAALQPERVLYALAVLQAQQDQQDQEALQQSQSSQQAPGAATERVTTAASAAAAPPLQAALCAWLDGSAGGPAWQRQRCLHFAVLLAEAGLLCPAAYLHSCLAAGVTPAAPTAAHNSAGSFRLAVLHQLHPLLDFPTLREVDGGDGNGGDGGSGLSSSAWGAARRRYAATRAAVLSLCSCTPPPPGAAATAAAAAAAAADEVDAGGEVADMEWEALVLSNGSEGDSAVPAGADADSAGVRRQAEGGLWGAAPGLRRLHRQLLMALGLVELGPPFGNSAIAVADDFEALLVGVARLEAWEKRHTAAVLLAAAKAYLVKVTGVSLHRGGSAAHGPPSLAAASPPGCSNGDDGSGGGSGGPSELWLLQLHAVLAACHAHREVLSLLATSLNLLQRAVAAAARTATHGGGGTGRQPPPSPLLPQHQLSEALEAAQRGWSQLSGVAPAQLMALLSCYSRSLAASDIAVKLLPMLTGGLWRLQELPPLQQQLVRHNLQGQLELAAQLLAMPSSISGTPGGGGSGSSAGTAASMAANSSLHQWLDKMQQEHGGGHWLTVILQQQAAVWRARSSGAAGNQQRGGAGGMLAFLQRARQLALGGAHGIEQQQQQQQGVVVCDDSDEIFRQRLLLQAQQLPLEAGTGCPLGAGAGGAAAAAALAAVQRSLVPADLLAVLAGSVDDGSSSVREQGRQGPQQLLQGLAPGVGMALLADPHQAYQALRQERQPPPGAPVPWHLAAALLGSCGGACGDWMAGLTSNDAMMAAAVAAAVSTSAGCCWFLLRLLLDEPQWQGGHRLAEAERHLAARCAALEG